MRNQFQYLETFNPVRETLRYMQPREISHEEYMQFHFGSNYLGNNLIRCDYCKINAVMFIGYFNNHVCVDCQEEIKSLS